MSSRARARRILSLVPSLTEALFALDLGGRLVGATDWCVHPKRELEGLPRVGGTKNPSLERIAELHPDLVLANREENRRSDVEALIARGIDVWVTYPRSVREALALLRQLAELGASDAARRRVIDPIAQALARAAARPRGSRPRVFCPIWRQPWMAVGGDTYANDLLRVCGGHNVFEERPERRYPIVTLEEVEAAAPDVILLPDEPYAFGPHEVAELAALPVPAARTGRIHPIDGTLISWYGPRIAQALERVGALLRLPRGDPEGAGPGREGG